jgi:hypothetical protein
MKGYYSVLFLQDSPMDMTDAELIATIIERNQAFYTDVQRKGDAGIAGINRFMFTWAILSGMNEYGYEDRWCYSNYAKAKAAFDAWDGLDGTEPTGWHRHPGSGRRVDENGRAYVEF